MSQIDNLKQNDPRLFAEFNQLVAEIMERVERGKAYEKEKHAGMYQEVYLGKRQVSILKDVIGFLPEEWDGIPLVPVPTYDCVYISAHKKYITGSHYVAWELGDYKDAAQVFYETVAHIKPNVDLKIPRYD